MTYKTPRLSETQMEMRSLRFIFRPRRATQGKAASAKSIAAAYAGMIIRYWPIFFKQAVPILTTVDEGHHGEAEIAHLLVYQQRVPDGFHRSALRENGDGKEDAEYHHGRDTEPKEPTVPGRAIS